MPSLARIGDTLTLQNLYGGRTVFMVEGPGDRNVFERVLGPGLEADVEFKVAPNGAGEGGCRAVRERVREERFANPRVFGLLDGEAAASFDGIAELLACEEPMFTLAGEDGFLFLAEHELENIYFRHADVCAAVSRQASAARVHLHPPAAVQATLDRVIHRFVGGSLFKYTSAHFHRLGKVRGIIGTRVFGGGTRRQVTDQVRASVTSGGNLGWGEFLAKVAEIKGVARGMLAIAASDEAERRRWLLRIADGKEMLAKLRYDHGSISDAVEGGLIDDVCAGPYPATFRAALIRLAGIVPTTYAA